MSYLICADCAYTTGDLSRTTCEYCRSELLKQCPLCMETFEEERAMFCRKCGYKLRISITPIQ